MIAKKLLTTIAFAFVLLFSGCAEDDFVGVDGLCPLVVSTVPEDGDIDVPLNQVITATFNEKMNPSTITDASFTVSANGALINGMVTYSDSTAVFTPSSLLDENTEYTGTITTLAKDERGNALQEDYVWSFVTVLPLPEFSVDVTSNPTIGGLTAGAGLFEQGTSVTVTAVPNAGYTFTNWTENEIQVSTSPNYQFVIIGDRTLVANYTLIPPTQFAVNLSSSPVEGGSTNGSGSFDAGNDVTVTATANTGYTFVNWTLAGVEVSTNTNYTFALIANTNLVANFVLTEQFSVELTANPNEGGVTDGAGLFDSGLNVQVTATPNDGYTFENWTENNVEVSTNSTYEFLLTKDIVLVANFIADVIPPVNAGLCPNPAVDLGLAGNYAVLAESAISTTGVTSVTGDMGISPLAASFITGFGLTLHSSGTYSTSTLVNGKIYAADYTAPTPSNLTTTVDNMHTAFTTANGLAPDRTEYLAGNLNNVTLPAGVYKYGTGLLLSNTITLDGGGVDCAAFVFQIAGDLTVANSVKIVLINGAKADNIFWVTAGAGAVIGSDVDFSGNILSKTLISLEARSTVKGRLLAQSAVSLIGNSVVKPSN